MGTHCLLGQVTTGRAREGVVIVFDCVVKGDLFLFAPRGFVCQ